MAENPRTPVISLATLAKDHESDVRIGVCDNPASPAGLLLLLAGDSNADVRYAIAENSHVPRQILCLLARDENPYVATRAQEALNRVMQIQLVSHPPAA